MVNEGIFIQCVHYSRGKILNSNYNYGSKNWSGDEFYFIYVYV